MYDSLFLIRKSSLLLGSYTKICPRLVSISILQAMKFVIFSKYKTYVFMSERNIPFEAEFRK